MIVVTIQGTEDGGKHITAYDGRIVIGDEQQKIIDELYKKLKHFNINDDKKIQRKKKYNFFTMEHEIRDIAGRRRKALIFWDQYATDSIIKNTFDIIGLDYEEIKLKIEETKKSEDIKNKFIISSVIMGLTSLFSGALLYKKFNYNKCNILILGYSKELLFNFLKENDKKIIDSSNVKKLIVNHNMNTLNLSINKTEDNVKDLKNHVYSKICYVFSAKNDNLDNVFNDIDKLLKYNVQLSFLCIIDNSITEEYKKLIDNKINDYILCELNEDYKIKILDFLIK